MVLSVFSFFFFSLPFPLIPWHADSVHFLFIYLFIIIIIIIIVIIIIITLAITSSPPLSPFSRRCMHINVTLLCIVDYQFTEEGPG